MQVEEYFNEWWISKELPKDGFNKTAMLDFAESYHQAKLNELESKTFSQSEMLKISQDWTNERSVGDTKQDADCCYYFLQGLRKMNTLK